MVWIALALSGDWWRKTKCDRTLLQPLAEVPWATRVHEARGRPRKQPDLLLEVTTPLVGDESPLVDPIQCVPQQLHPIIEQWTCCTDDAGSRQSAGHARA